MSRSRLLALVAVLALLAAVRAPAADTATPVAPPIQVDPKVLDQKLLAEAKTGSEIMANLTYLSDVIGPRLTGSAALKRANDWTADKMRSYGLSNVHLEGWEIPVGWERGPVSVRLVEPQAGRPLTAAAMGWTPGTNGRITGDVVVMEARNSNDLAAYKGKLKGAIVLRGRPTVIRPLSDMDLFGGQRQGGRGGRGGPGAQGDGRTPRPDSERRDRSQFQQMMAFRRELTEFLHTEGAAVLMMDSGKPHGLLNMTGNWRGNDRVSARDPLPTLFVAHEHYAMLYRLATRKQMVRTRVEVEINNRFIPGPIGVYNTVGEIRGSEKPDEFVVLGAHLDSWDLGQGTTDNGTGTAVVLEAARVLVKSGIRPRRTIRFCLFTGEEQGLHGSKAYVERHKAEMPKTSLALVHDTGTGRVVGITLENRAVLKPILEAELVSLKPLGVEDFNLRSMPGSDHMSFERVGVPGLAVKQDWAEYRLSHHSQSDTLDKAREPDLIQGAQTLVVAAVRVANLPRLLPRDKPVRERPGREAGERRSAPPAEKTPAKDK
jgi:hypothetical protein